MTPSRNRSTSAFCVRQTRLWGFRRRSWGLAGRAILLGGIIGSAAVPVAAQVQIVNTYTTGEQLDPVVAQTTDGSFLVAWQSEGQDGDGEGIVTRRLDASGTPVGSEAVLNSTTTGDQRAPSIASLTDGRYIVVWQGAGGADVRGRFVTSAGAADSAELTLSSLDAVIDPVVAAQAGGDFAVVWSDATNLYFEAFDDVGTSKAAATVVAGAPIVDVPSRFGGASLTLFGDGTHLVVWESDQRVFARHLDTDGTPLDAAFRLDDTEEIQMRPSATLGTGGILVTWNRNGSRQNGRFVAQDGTLPGSVLTLSTTTGGRSATLLPTATGFQLTYPRYSSSFGGLTIEGLPLDAAGAATGPAGRLTIGTSFDGNVFNTHRHRFRDSKILQTQDGKILTVWMTGVTSREIMAQIQPGFRITAPFDALGCVGSPLEIEIEVEATGSTDPVTLSVPDLDGVTFSQNPVTPPATVTLTGPVQTVTRRGLDFTVEGTNGTSMDSVPGEVDIGDFSLEFAFPTPGATGVTVAPTLEWRLNADFFIPFSRTWEVELARDTGYTDLVAQAVTDNWFEDFFHADLVSFRTPVLEPGREYFWRVRANTPCGMDDWQEASFTTAPDFVVAEESQEFRGANYERSWTLEGDPNVAPTTDGGFVVATPGYYYYYYNEVLSTSMNSRIQQLPPAGGMGTFTVALERANTPYGGPAENDVRSPLVPSGPGFLVVWGGTQDLSSQPLEANGSKAGNAQVLADSPGSHTFPDLTNGPGDERLVVWSDRRSSSRISARRLASDGSAVGTEVQVSSDGTAQPGRPAAAWSPIHNEFLVVWQRDDADGQGIFGRRLASDASPIGADFQINAYTPGEQRNPSVETLTFGGDFLVVWQSSQGTPAQDGDGLGIVARRVAPGGPAGGEIAVNTYTTGDQTRPDVAAEPGGGGMLVTWDNGGSTEDPSGTGIRARRIDPNLVPAGQDFQVNQITDGNQWASRVTAHPQTHDFIVVWRENDRVLARRLEASTTIFVDGFESGNLTAWSQSSP